MTPADLQIPERGSAPVEDPAIVASEKLQEAAAALRALPSNNYADEQKPEYKAALKREKEADDAFSAAPVTSLAGALVKLRALGKDIVEDSGTDAWDLGHVRTVTAYLEGVECAPSVVGDDPAVTAFAELEAAWAVFDGLGDEEPGHGVNGDPRHAAAYRRFADARDAVYAVVPVSLAGVAAKVRGMLKHQSEAYELGPDFNIMAKSMLPFLERAPAPAPKPDPVVVLFSKWGALEDEIIAFGKAHPDFDDPDVEEQRDKLGRRQSAVEDQIIETAVTSVGGIAVKLRLLAYMKIPIAGLPELYATPAKDTDFEGFIKAWRYEGDLFLDDKLLIDSLRDAERLAGTL